MLFFEIVLIVILLICLWLAFHYIKLLCAKNKADKAFIKFFEKLKKQAVKTQSFLEELKSANNIDIELINQTQGFISKLLEFSIEKDGNERIIGYSNAITLNINKLLTELENNNEQITVYVNSRQDFIKAKEDYNNAIKPLKRCVDVFPSSLMARFKRFTFLDQAI